MPSAPEVVAVEQLTDALAACWRRLQDRLPGLPAALVRPGPSKAGCGAGQWARGGLVELVLDQAVLARGETDVLAALLHEAAHGLARARGVNDTSREGRYHNQRFAEIATELGLSVADAGTRGWAITALRDEEAAEEYERELHALAAALTDYRAAAPDRSSKPTAPPSRIVAACGCPRRIRIAHGTLAIGPIVCGVCGQDFTPEK